MIDMLLSGKSFCICSNILMRRTSLTVSGNPFSYTPPSALRSDPFLFSKESQGMEQRSSSGFGRGWVPMERDIGIPNDDLPAPRIAHGFTPERQVRFLHHLATSGHVRRACAAVGVSAQAAYVCKRRDLAFARGWDAALVLARDAAEEVLAERALNGTREMIFYRGEVVGSRIRFDPRLLLAHLARLDKHHAEARDAANIAARFDEYLGEMLTGEPEFLAPLEDIEPPEPTEWQPARPTREEALLAAREAALYAYARRPRRSPAGKARRSRCGKRGRSQPLAPRRRRRPIRSLRRRRRGMGYRDRGPARPPRCLVLRRNPSVRPSACHLPMCPFAKPRGKWGGPP